MDYRAAYEALSKALWKYDKTHNDAYIRLMLAVRDIERKLDKPPRVPLQFIPTEKDNNE